MTPIVVNGNDTSRPPTAWSPSEPETGKEVWRYKVSGGVPSRRGVAYRPGEGDVGPRVYVTSQRRLIALDARTGVAAEGFGTKGEVNMGPPYNSAATVYKQLLIGTNAPGRRARVQREDGREGLGLLLDPEKR